MRGTVVGAAGSQCLPREGRGVLRWLALTVLVAAPVFVIVVYVVAVLLWEIVLAAAGRGRWAGGTTQ
jgi:hypothetical protein